MNADSIWKTLNQNEFFSKLDEQTTHYPSIVFLPTFLYQREVISGQKPPNQISVQIWLISTTTIDSHNQGRKNTFWKYICIEYISICFYIFISHNELENTKVTHLEWFRYLIDFDIIDRCGRIRTNYWVKSITDPLSRLFFSKVDLIALCGWN